jgi:PAS domain S-box-containing protein
MWFASILPMHDVKPHPNRIIAGIDPRENPSLAASLVTPDGPMRWSGFAEPNVSDETPDAEDLGANFENAVHWFYTLDAKGNFLALNPSALKSLGYTRAEARRLTVAQVTAPELRAVAQELLEKTLAEGSIPPQEWECRTKSGAVMHIEVSLWAVMRADGSKVIQHTAGSSRLRRISSRRWCGRCWTIRRTAFISRTGNRGSSNSAPRCAKNSA